MINVKNHIETLKTVITEFNEFMLITERAKGLTVDDLSELTAKLRSLIEELEKEK